MIAVTTGAARAQRVIRLKLTRALEYHKRWHFSRSAMGMPRWKLTVKWQLYNGNKILSALTAFAMQLMDTSSGD